MVNEKQDLGTTQELRISVQLETIQSLVLEDYTAVHSLLQKAFSSKTSLIQTIGTYFLKQPGKCLRPLLVLLSYKACFFYGRAVMATQQPITLAAIMELIHIATLLHDDVVDAAEKRRGQASVNQRFGNEAAILAGDFLYAKAFQLLIDLQHPEAMHMLVTTTQQMAEGEALQLLKRGQWNTTQEEYLEMIRAKTATLFEACTFLGAQLAQATPTLATAWKQYGVALGLAFQVMDDVLDYEAIAPTKDRGRDLQEGKMTLPLIYALSKANRTQKKRLQSALDLFDFRQVLELLQELQALEYSRQYAANYIRSAKEALETGVPPSIYREAALRLGELVLKQGVEDTL